MKKLESYSFNGDGEINCHFYGYTEHVHKVDVAVCVVNDLNKTVSPVHGYYSPHPLYKSAIRLAKKLGYILID